MSQGKVSIDKVEPIYVKPKLPIASFKGSVTLYGVKENKEIH